MFALASMTERSPRQTRHMSFIAEFTSDIHHIKGENKVVADTLSRPSVNAITLAGAWYQLQGNVQGSGPFQHQGHQPDAYQGPVEWS